MDPKFVLVVIKCIREDNEACQHGPVSDRRQKLVVPLNVVEVSRRSEIIYIAM